MERTRKGGEDEDQDEAVTLDRQGRDERGRPLRSQSGAPTSSAAAIATAAGLGPTSYGPLHTHAVWRGVYKVAEKHTNAAMRFDLVDVKRGLGEGVLRLYDPTGAVEREARFDFVAERSTGGLDQDSPIALRMRWNEHHDLDNELQTEMSSLTLSDLHTGVHRSRNPLRSVSFSPPPARHAPSSPTFSSSLPTNSRRTPASPPMSWASIVRGGPIEPAADALRLPEEEEITSGTIFTKTQNTTFNTTTVSPIIIPGAALPNVFDDTEFPAPSSPPLRPPRRRHASTSLVGAQSPATAVPLKARSPICGAFWSHCHLTIADMPASEVKDSTTNKQLKIFDLRYFGASGSDAGWHHAPALATRTFATAACRIL